jgi:predicted NAD/FAD-binding protein
MKLAIVGSGISAMTCAHYLKSKYDISIFEKNDYLGGHTHTHRMDGFTLDTGFIVFNLQTYPNMLKMFEELGIERRKSDMSFSVHNLRTGLQYTGYKPFAQKRNLLSPRHWKFLREIQTFFRVGKRDLQKRNPESIREYCSKNGLSDYFLENFIVPLSSAIWSTPDTKEFPIGLLLPFFHNHGLLSARKDFQWYTVKGGSDTYTKKIAAGLDIHLEEPVLSVNEGASVQLETARQAYEFDYVILACHSDESLAIAKGLPEKKRELLSKFRYNKNLAVLHTDESAMPSLRQAWSSWNHIIDGDKASTVYWLNKLQGPKTPTNFFVSINPFRDIRQEKIIRTMHYDHPLFTIENFELQKRLQELNEQTRILFAGAYFRHGFHEDGCKSGMDVVGRLQ